VDSSLINRIISDKILKAAGHVCEEAVDGLEAVEKVCRKMSEKESTRKYDAILMDFVMPHMDGPTATREIRQLGYKGAIFGVVSSDVESNVQQFLKSGANKVLVKPFKLEEFHSEMDRLSK
jgi:CheY-like chemotaxis protein